MLQIIKLWFADIFKETVFAIMMKVVLMLTDSMSCGIKMDHKIWILKNKFNQIIHPKLGKNKEKAVEGILWISKWIWIKISKVLL
jgi:hypothetical protein